MEVRGSQTVSASASPTSDVIKALRTPEVPARRNTSDLTLLSQESSQTHQNQEFTTQTKSQFLRSSESTVVSHCTKDIISEPAVYFSQKSSSVYVPSVNFDVNTDKVPGKEKTNTTSQSVQYLAPRVVKAEYQTSEQVSSDNAGSHTTETGSHTTETGSQKVQPLDVLVPVKENITVLRPWGSESLTDQEARMQTRQRILQSAKLRQSGETKLLQRKFAENN